MSRIRPCRGDERAAILDIVNAAAEAYRGVIPADRWHEPYMPAEELDAEIAAGVAFWGYEDGDGLVGVMGIQPVGDVDLIRHAYVVPSAQRRGIGGALLEHHLRATDRPILVGTWAAAEWAIRFYERNGFELLSRERTAELLRRYWTIPERQIETSVVLAAARATVVPPGGGEIIGDAPDRRLEILCETDDLHATWTRMGPRREGASLHVHRRHHDLFYVLAGELTVRLGAAAAPLALAPGTLVHVPPMVVHGFANEADGELRYINLHAPGTGFADHLRGLRDGRPVAFDQEPPPGAGERPPSELFVGPPPLDAGVVSVTVEEVDGSFPSGARGLYVLEGSLSVAGSVAPAGAWVTVPRGAAAAAISGAARVLAVRVG